MNLSGNPIDYLAAFVGGLLVSFSPCIYPLIPVSLGFIGVSSSGKKLRGLILSLIYVTGLAITYCLLGLVAALTGSLFGKFSIHPLTRIIVGIIFIFFGLSLWDFFTLKPFIFGPIFNPQKKSLWQTLLLGISSGLVISPCVSPVLGSILVFVATKRSMFYGATLLLTFAYGMGFTLILAGTFSALLLSLPKPGVWMERIKNVGGLILIATGIFYIYSIR